MLIYIRYTFLCRHAYASHIGFKKRSLRCCFSLVEARRCLIAFSFNSHRTRLARNFSTIYSIYIMPLFIYRFPSSMPAHNVIARAPPSTSSSATVYSPLPRRQLPPCPSLLMPPHSHYVIRAASQGYTAFVEISFEREASFADTFSAACSAAHIAAFQGLRGCRIRFDDISKALGNAFSLRAS